MLINSGCFKESENIISCLDNSQKMSIMNRKHIKNGNVKVIYWKNNVNDEYRFC